MARYDYREFDKDGNATNKLVERVFSMREQRPDVIPLGDGRTLRYDVASTLKHVKTQSTAGYPHELICFSGAPSQVEEMRRKHPERTYTDNGMLITHSMAETKRIAREEGCVDQSSPAPLKSSAVKKLIKRRAKRKTHA